MRRGIKPFEEYPQVTTTVARLRYSKGGVYFLYDSDGLQYIGQSANVAQRVRGHPAMNGTDKSLWTVVVVKINNKGWRMHWERILIKAYKPPKNMQCNPAYMIVNHHTYIRRPIPDVFPDD